jgi:Asp-tRNA(Asn)/Glu-tRNA(Gln) amidotransferase A subunit family amidase
MNEIIFLPAVVMAERIWEKKISPVELVDAHLTQIEKLNSTLNAFVHVDADAVRRAAQAAEAAVMQAKTRKALGPLHGIPVSIKSSFEVSGEQRAQLCSA